MIDIQTFEVATENGKSYTGWVNPVYMAEQCSNCLSNQLCSECAIEFKEGEDSSLDPRAVTACEKDDVETLQQLIRSDKDLIENIDASGRTPICIAASNGSYSCFKELFSKKSDPNWQSNTGYSPLHEVCAADDPENSLDILLKQKDVNLDAKTNEGKTAVMIAYESGNKNMLQLLLEVKSVDLAIKDLKGQTLRNKMENDLENENG